MKVGSTGHTHMLHLYAMNGQIDRMYLKRLSFSKQNSKIKYLQKVENKTRIYLVKHLKESCKFDIEKLVQTFS